MAADTQRKAYRYTCNMIRPQIYSEKSLMESVVDFFSDVVPQAYTGTQKAEDKEKIQWVRFENCDCNDVAKNPDMFRSDTKGLPLLLILGYSNGVQIWNITTNGEAQEILSMRQGPVRICRILPNPDPVLGHTDSYSSKRPLVVLCDSSSAGQPYCGVKFVSLKTGDEVHSISFKTLPVQNIECNKRFLVIVFLEKICVHESSQFQQLFWITSCFPCSGPNVNPIALSARWLAYADKRLVAMHQSCGGMSGDGSQSYAATVLSAAKGAFKGLSMFGEAMVSSVTGSTKTAPPKRDYVQLDNGNRPGIVTVVDIQNIHNDHFNVNEDNEGDGLIAHFHAHANEPVSNLAFDPTGTLLVTACKLGHNFHVFRLMAHPVSSSLGAVHHLYTLHRGETTAKVIDISFNHDSRWITVSSHRGTTHLFPITPYGGSVNVRTHCKPHVVNRASRFHRSAGLDEFDHSVGRRSPVLSTSPSSSGQYDRYPTLIQQNTLNNNMGNPRLPPYPHPITIYPAFQVKQPLNVVLNPGNKNQSPSHSPTGFDNVYCVCAKFCTPRLCVVGSPKLDMERREAGKRPVDSLFVMAQSGTLVEYVLEPRAKSVTDKVTDDCLLELNVVGRMQWNLQRLKNSPELRPPLPSNSPLILAHEAVTSQVPTAPDLYDLPGLTRQDSKDSLSSDHSGKDDTDEQWLSQVEIITHAGPHRRLWMGPQFSFKTYQENTTVLSSTSSSLLSQSPDSNMAAMDLMGDEGDLESLKLQPTRSNPVSMPNARPAYRRLSGSDSSPGPSHSIGAQSVPMVIEAGSFDQSPHLLDVYSNWTESSVAKQPRGSDDLEEDRLKETLADAMVESPCKDIEKLSLRHQDIPKTSIRPESTRMQTTQRATPGKSDKKDSGQGVKERVRVDGGRKEVSRKETVELQQRVMDEKQGKPEKNESAEGISIKDSNKCDDIKVETSVQEETKKVNTDMPETKSSVESNKNGKKKGKAKKSLDSQLKSVSKSVVDEKLSDKNVENTQTPKVEKVVSSSGSKTVKDVEPSVENEQSELKSNTQFDKNGSNSGQICASNNVSTPVPSKRKSVPENSSKANNGNLNDMESLKSFPKVVATEPVSPESTKSTGQKTEAINTKDNAVREETVKATVEDVPDKSSKGKVAESDGRTSPQKSKSKKKGKKQGKNEMTESVMKMEESMASVSIDERICTLTESKIGNVETKSRENLFEIKENTGKSAETNLEVKERKSEETIDLKDSKSESNAYEFNVKKNKSRSNQDDITVKKSKRKSGNAEPPINKSETDVNSGEAKKDDTKSVEIDTGVKEIQSSELANVEKMNSVEFDIVEKEETPAESSQYESISFENMDSNDDEIAICAADNESRNLSTVNDKSEKEQIIKQNEKQTTVEQDIDNSFAPAKSKRKKKKESTDTRKNEDKLNGNVELNTEEQTELKSEKTTDKITRENMDVTTETEFVSHVSDYKTSKVSVDVNLKVEEAIEDNDEIEILPIEKKLKHQLQSIDQSKESDIVKEDIVPEQGSKDSFKSKKLNVAKDTGKEKNAWGNRSKMELVKQSINETKDMNKEMENDKEITDETAEPTSSNAESIETKKVVSVDDITGAPKKTDSVNDNEMVEVKSKKKRKKKKNGMEESIYVERSETLPETFDCKAERSEDKSNKSTQQSVSARSVTTEKDVLSPSAKVEQPIKDEIVKKRENTADAIDSEVKQGADNDEKAINDDATLSKIELCEGINKPDSTEIVDKEGNGKNGYNKGIDEETPILESKSSSSSKDSDSWFTEETVTVQKKKNKRKKKNADPKEIQKSKSPEPEVTVVESKIGSASIETLVQVDKSISDATSIDSTNELTETVVVEEIPSNSDEAMGDIESTETVDVVLGNNGIQGLNGGMSKSIYVEDAIDELLSEVKKMEDSAESGSKYETAESAEDDPSIWERSEFEECLEDNNVDEISEDKSACSDITEAPVIDKTGKSVKDKRKITFEIQAEGNLETEQNKTSSESDKESPTSESKLKLSASIMVKSMYDDSAGSSSRSSEEREDTQPVKAATSKTDNKNKKKKRKNKR